MPSKKTPPGKDKGKQEPPPPKPAPQPTPPPPTYPEGQKAVLRFQLEWRHHQHGEIKAGGKLVIEYDPARLTKCRESSHGAQVWDIDVGMIFHPGGQRFDGSVMRKVRMPNGGPITSLEPQPFEVAVPAGAERVEMWFRNYYTLGTSCEAWDSRYCQNYWFTVARG
jgi:hypothetical protein